MRRVRWVFVHTAAFDGPAGVEEIREWHRQRGWVDIGYHYVVRKNGDVEIGRPLEAVGAHVYGANSQSVGICCEGNGDKADHTPVQREALLGLCASLLRKYRLTPDDVLGHREVNRLVDEGKLPASIAGKTTRTAKTCPGTKVDMDEIRAGLYPEPKIGLAA